MNTFKNIRLGIFLLLGLVFFILALYFIGSKRNMFSSSLTIKARFHNINGLQLGNNVRLMGIDVGTVKKISILNDTLVEVEMVIKESSADFIKKDAKAIVATDGLMGNRIINISGGNASSPSVVNGDLIRTEKQVNTDDILRTVDNASQYTAVLSAELVKMVNNINTGNGPLGVILKDTSVSYNLKHTINDLRETSKQSVQIAMYFKDILSNIKNSDGTFNTALNDTAMRNNLQNTIADLEMAAVNLKKATYTLEKLTDKVESGNGTVSTLLNDTAFAADFKTAIISAKNGMEGLNQNMEALKHNFLLRPYFKKQEKNKK